MASVCGKARTLVLVIASQLVCTQPAHTPAKLMGIETINQHVRYTVARGWWTASEQPAGMTQPSLRLLLLA
jgi:hypothetical protein